jgi:SNF2 family DNA or RNA helicase
MLDNSEPVTQYIDNLCCKFSMSDFNVFQSFVFHEEVGKESVRSAVVQRTAAVVASSSSGGSSPWLETRRPDAISSSQKQSNISTAVLQRKALHGSIPKVRRTDLESDDEDRHHQNTGSQKAMKKSTLVRDSLLHKALDEDYDPLHDHRQALERARAAGRDQRVIHRTTTLPVNTTPDNNTTSKPIMQSKKRSVLDSSDDDEEEKRQVPQPQPQHAVVVDLSSLDSPISLRLQSSKPAKKQQKNTTKTTTTTTKTTTMKFDRLNDHDYDEDEEEEADRTAGDWSQAALKAKAAQVVAQCEGVSANLRRSLALWSGTNSNGEPPIDGDCVALMSIDQQRLAKQGDKAMLTDADIAVACPTLRLNNYQLVGVNWLRLLFEHDVNGVLADDMGLGKTVQTISFLGWLSLQSPRPHQRQRQPHLIVVPASTLANWENEFEKFCPLLRVVRYHGSQDERAQLRHDLRSMIAKEEVDVVLSTYTIFEREACKQDRGFLYAQSFDFLVLDEAHCIKNADSSRYANLNALRTSHRLLLSGTPVQNNLSELLAMLSFLMPSVFGRDDCQLMMEAFGWNKSTQQDPHSGLSLKQLKGMLAPFVLRRLKRDVLDQLTDKHSELQMLDMPETQQRIYEGIISRYTVRKQRQPLSSSAKPSSSSCVATDEQPSKRVRKPSSSHHSDPTDVVDLSGTHSSSSKLATTTDVQTLTPDDILQQFTGNEAKHLFTALRKAANHPLLLRVHYTDDNVSFALFDC